MLCQGLGLGCRRLSLSGVSFGRLPKSGSVLVLSSNIIIGVKVALDVFFFGGGVGFATDQLM